jgi:hypothetical protein
MAFVTQAGLLIADAVIRAKQLPGRTLKFEGDDEAQESHERLYEQRKKICRSRRRRHDPDNHKKRERYTQVELGYAKDSKAFAELEKMFKLSVDVDTVSGRLKDAEAVVEGKIKVTNGVFYNVQDDGRMYTKIAVLVKASGSGDGGKGKKGKKGSKGRRDMDLEEKMIERPVTHIAPLMNRLELRDYAARTEFPESEDPHAEFQKANKQRPKIGGGDGGQPDSPGGRARSVTGGLGSTKWDLNDEVLAIDHRKCCGTRDLDSVRKRGLSSCFLSNFRFCLSPRACPLGNHRVCFSIETSNESSKQERCVFFSGHARCLRP